MAANPKNLGYKVTLRTIDYGALVRDSWGEEWNEREWVYEFDNGYRFLSTDRDKTGIYGVNIVTNIFIDPFDPQNPNTEPIWLLTESLDEIGTL